jgi:hypothetical protein
VNSVAAKIAEEILVLFENRYFNTTASQQVSEHHTRGSAPHNAATCFHHRMRHPRAALLHFAWKL